MTPIIVDEIKKDTLSLASVTNGFLNYVRNIIVYTNRKFVNFINCYNNGFITPITAKKITRLPLMFSRHP